MIIWDKKVIDHYHRRLSYLDGDDNSDSSLSEMNINRSIVLIIINGFFHLKKGYFLIIYN